MPKRVRKDGRPNDSVDYDYMNQYQRDHYDRIVILGPAGTRDKIKAAAMAEGESMSHYIVRQLPSELTNVMEV